MKPTDAISYLEGYQNGRIAGRREVVEWIERENPFSFIYGSSTSWQAKLKEWGLDEENTTT